ncbi:MAG TPA: TIGR02996 domain-containing protein [Gemmataceae bacterium]|nr:TIGR02996 domain-containing protein [Gemmataceae bacterium]
MSSLRAALIAAIREAPDDDAPRLICADWMEEQGGEANVARAEFIRTQIQRAKLPPEDIRQSELQARELRLLKRWAPVWCGSHFVFKKVCFRRGFIEYVHLHLRHFLHHRRQMFALEPVRDVRLTGWFRVLDDLVRRVAGCEELKYIETLRIHHQGPHHDPRSNLVDLLESPHLTGLRALHGTQVQFDADARRRFERLPILRRITQLHLPILYRWPENPGAWFSDGREDFTQVWPELKSLHLSYETTLDVLARLVEMPFWNRLTVLELVIPYQTREALSFLRDRIPKSLKRLGLYVNHAPADFSMADSFFERLAQVPLESLRFGLIPLRPAILGHLLDGASRWNLKELTLSACDLTEDHASILAGSPRVKNLHSLNLSSNWKLGNGEAQILFASKYLSSLAHLDLSGTQIGTEGMAALATAREWTRLRSLALGAGLDKDGLRTLLASPNLRHLTSLTIGSDYQGENPVNITPETAVAITELPHLASLRLQVGHCDPRSKQILSTNESLPWVSIDCEDEYDIRTYRANLAPERWPPIDDPLEPQFGEIWGKNGGALV